MKTLKQFYRELQAWIDAGCPEHEVFERKYAICDNLHEWSGFDGKLRSELEGQFVKAELHRRYPFSKGNSDIFDMEGMFGALYKNPARLQWIKEHAA